MKTAARDLPLLAWYLAYFGATVVLFLAIPLIGRLLTPYPPLPWEYWWVFLYVTPLLSAIVLIREARTGRFTWFGTAVFMIAALMLGVIYRWFSYDLSGVV